MPRRRQPREPGQLEQEILAVVAAADAPVTPAQVQAELGAAAGAPLAYTTVMTTLARLHTKGALTRQPAGRGYAYGLAAGPDELPAALTARQMRRLLDAEGDRAGVLARFVADLTADDEQLLAALLQEHTPPAPPRRTPPDPQADPRPSGVSTAHPGDREADR
ncbi:MAG TPA: BlaI/MecI/CopY family transcriptional regulator [Kineosporiaceae bacterium]